MNIVSVLSAKGYTLGEGAVLSLVGFLIVLSVLALLVGIFYLSGFIFKSKLFNKPKKEKPKKQTVVQNNDEEDEEVVAAITAAIACMLSSEADDGNPPEFVIKRIQRKK